YTTKVDDNRHGAVTLRDAKDGDEVTIQNSEVQKISKEQFEAEKSTSGDIPASATAAVAAAAVAPAATPEQFRANLIAGKDQIDKTVASLSELAEPSQSDLNAAYSRYGQNIDAMDRHAQQIKSEADAMRKTREAYFAKWDARIAQTDNPTIRAEAESRRAKLRDAQEKIAADSQQVKDAYQPFMSDLRDTRKFLSSDLSKDTVAVLSPQVAKAKADGETVKKRIDAVVADLDAIEARMGNQPAPSASGAGASAAPAPAPALAAK